MQTLQEIILALLNEQGAADIELIDLKGKTVVADYFVLATGRSTTNVRALADFVEEKLSKEYGVEPMNREGREDAQWIIIDYDAVMLHVFTEEVRKKYSLEKLWGGEAVREVDVAPAETENTDENADPAAE